MLGGWSPVSTKSDGPGPYSHQLHRLRENGASSCSIPSYAHIWARVIFPLFANNCIVNCTLIKTAKASEILFGILTVFHNLNSKYQHRFAEINCDVTEEIQFNLKNFADVD